MVTGQTLGHVLLTRRQGSSDDWYIDHAGEPQDRADVIDEGVAYVADNPSEEYAVAAVVIEVDE